MIRTRSLDTFELTGWSQFASVFVSKFNIVSMVTRVLALVVTFAFFPKSEVV